jgi:hypothetical protein
MQNHETHARQRMHPGAANSGTFAKIDPATFAAVSAAYEPNTGGARLPMNRPNYNKLVHHNHATAQTEIPEG